MGSKGRFRKDTRRRDARRTTIEPLEDRQMFSAEPLGGGIEQHSLSAPDFWYDTNLERDLDALLGDIEQNLASAHQLTGVTQARDDYGFYGIGQTVAVIDSGIAWDHPNLGNGFGADARVVGGWDFTDEDDANPYDDGPAGSHGTHVAGIVGATASAQGDSGVAPGVDFVGLRVFNDQGSGYFSWVEKALKWVHTNRNSFANPITAVNLSLGTSWNSATVPTWATLEDEFAQLKADGIFIAVSAGNSFATYNAAGLSYPAASASVVPVMSVDDSGSLSYFSQRHTRAIAAPGRSIRSTVPDYVGNQNGMTDDWANYSGTSMASPYVAGASVLVREAMQFVGYTNITEDTIYSHMMSTADEFFDLATNQFYKRLNVGAAIDALIPDDDFGSTAETAHELGTIGAATSDVTGLIGKRSDVDYFRFTAGATGTVKFTADTTHFLDAVWAGDGAVSGPEGNTYTIDVVAGQSYTFGLSTSDGIGYFDLTISAESVFTFADWGTITQSQTNDVATSGETWYRVQASQAGYLTAEAFFASAGGRVELAWFDANLQQVASGVAGVDCQRTDWLVGAGEQLFLRVTGTSDDVDVRLTNLVSLDGPTVQVTGTDGNDTIAFAAGATLQLMVNGIAYEFDAAAVHSILVDGAGGADSITMTGTAGNETAVLCDEAASFSGAGFTAIATNVEHVAVYGSGGADEAYLYDSASDDKLTAYPRHVTLALANGHVVEAVGFQQTRTYGSFGTDTAEFFDSAGDDVVAAWSTRAVLYGSGYWNEARGFDRTYAYATDGNDRAALYDTAGDDVYVAWYNQASMSGSGYRNEARGFDRVVADAVAGGHDLAKFYDTVGDDVYVACHNQASMSGSGYKNEARGFDRVVADAVAGGFDQAMFYDTAGDDVFVAWYNQVSMSGSGYKNEARGFDRDIAHAVAGGYDLAMFYDTAGDDVYVAWSNRAVMYGAGYINDTRGFERTTAHAVVGGNDRAEFYDSAGDDVYSAWANRAVMYGGNYINDARGFERTTAQATAGGKDKALLHDSTGDDYIVARAWGASLSGQGYHNEARNFKHITAQLINGGNQTIDVQLVDYIFDLVGK